MWFSTEYYEMVSDKTLTGADKISSVVMPIILSHTPKIIEIKMRDSIRSTAGTLHFCILLHSKQSSSVISQLCSAWTASDA